MPTQVKIVGENGAVSVVDYPWNPRHARNMDYLLAKRMIEIHEIDDDENETPIEASRRVIRRITPKDVANLR